MTHGPGALPLEELLAQAAWLRRLAGTLVAGEAAADDLAQETWLAALRHPPDTGGELKPWLARVARNLASNFRRGEARRTVRDRREPPDDAELDPARLAEAVDAQRALAEAVLRLEEPLRTTLVLRHFRGLDSAAIARAQGVPAGTVRWRLKRALELLRADLDWRFGERERWCSAFAVLLPRAAPLAIGVTLMSTKLGWAAALLLGAGLAGWWWVDRASATSPEAGASTPPLQVALASPLRSPTAEEPAPREETPARAALASLPALTEPGARECCIVGRVLDGEGRGIPGARVAARGAMLRETTLFSEMRGEEVACATESGAGGVYELAVPSHRPFVLEATHSAYPAVASEPAFAGERRNLVLLPGTTLAVQAILPGGAPAAGADVRVSLASRDSYDTLWGRQVVADADGLALFPGVPAGQSQVEARLGESYGVRAATIDGGGEARCSVELQATTRVEGVVVERGSGAPIAGASVGNARYGAGPVRTDAAGRFAFAGIEFGVGFWTLEAHAAGFGSAYQMVRTPEGAEPRLVRFELERAASVRGRVLDEARRPLAGAHVRLRTLLLLPPMTAAGDRKEARTDALGRFEVADVVPGATYRLIVGDAGVVRGIFTAGPLRAAEALDLGELVLGATGSLAGSAGGESCLVRLYWAEPGPWSSDDPLSHLATTRTDPQGCFAFDALAPGRYRLDLVAGEDRRERVNLPLLQMELELAPGEHRRDLRLDPDAPRVAGRVVGPDGRGLGSGWVRLFAVGAPATPVATGHTDGKGRFRLFPGAAGPFRLEVEDLCLTSAARTLEPVLAGGGELEIQLDEFRSPYSIRGRLRGEDGAPFAGESDLMVRFFDSATGMALHRVAFVEADGRFLMRNLRDVPYDLELLDFEGRYEAARLANVRPGETEVELRATPRP